MIEHLEIGRSGYFYRRKRRLTNVAIDTLFHSLRTSSQRPSQNLFRIERELFARARYSAICFSYERNPSFLEPAAGAAERVYGYVLLVECGAYVALFKSGLDLPSAFKTEYLDKVAGERVERAIARNDAVFEKLSLRNMSISPLTLRSKTLEGRDLENAIATTSASRFIPQAYSVRRPDGVYSATPNTGRISVRADRGGVEDAVTWASDIAALLDADGGQVSTFIRNFARPLELSSIPSGVRPTYVGIDTIGLSKALFDAEDGIRLVRSVGEAIEELDQGATEVILSALDRPFPVTSRRKTIEVKHVDGRTVIGKLKFSNTRIALRDLHIEEIDGIAVEQRSMPVGEDPDARPLARYIDREDMFTILFSDLALAYIEGALFRDEALAGGGASFLAHLQVAPSLAAAASEKGAFQENQNVFAADSVFRAVVDSIASDDVLLCDDLGDEWADFVGLTTNGSPSKISFYHAKHGAQSMSASAFHDSVGQAIKNLGRMTLPEEMLQAKLDSWDDFYRNAGVQTQIARIIRGGTREEIAAKLETVRLAPDSFRRVFIVTSSLSRGQTEATLAGAAQGLQPSPHFVQLYWLLMSYFSACIEMGVRGYVVCRP